MCVASKYCHQHLRAHTHIIAHTCIFIFRKKINFWWNIPKISSKHCHFTPQTAFSRNCTMFWPTFGTPSSCAQIALIIDSYESSWKFRFETCKFHFQRFNISTPFFAAKSVIYQSKQFDLVQVMTLTRIRTYNAMSQKIWVVNRLSPTPKIAKKKIKSNNLHILFNDSQIIRLFYRGNDWESFKLAQHFECHTSLFKTNSNFMYCYICMYLYVYSQYFMCAVCLIVRAHVRTDVYM